MASPGTPAGDDPLSPLERLPDDVLGLIASELPLASWSALASASSTLRRTLTGKDTSPGAPGTPGAPRRRGRGPPRVCLTEEGTLNVRIDDAALARLCDSGALSSCSSLGLARCPKVTSRGVGHVSRLPHLTSLDFACNDHLSRITPPRAPLPDLAGDPRAPPAPAAPVAVPAGAGPPSAAAATSPLSTAGSPPPTPPAAPAPPAWGPPPAGAPADSGGSGAPGAGGPRGPLDDPPPGAGPADDGGRAWSDMRRCVALLARGPAGRGLRSLDLSSCGLRDGDLAPLLALRGLERLSLASNDQLTCAGVRGVVARMPGLADLCLADCIGVRDDGVRAIAAGLGATLRALDLSCLSGLTDEGLAGAAGLSRLETCRLSWCSVTDAGLERMAGLACLRSLDLHLSQRITSGGLRHVSRMRGLGTLDLHHCSLDGPWGLAPLAALAGSLTSLDLSWCTGLRPKGLAPVSALTALRKLRCRQLDAATDAVMAGVAALTGLRSLDLAHCRRLTGAGVSRLRTLASLTRLDLHSARGVDDACLGDVAGLPLRHLDLSHCGLLTDAGVGRLAGLGALTQLQLSHVRRVSDVGVARAVKGMPRLRHLSLARCDRVTDSGLLVLGICCPELRHLSLVGLVRATEEGLAGLAGLPLRALHLYACRGIPGSDVTPAAALLERAARRCAADASRPGDGPVVG